LKQLAARLFPGKTYREYYADLYRDGQPGWERTKAAFAELARACRARGIPLKVVLLPELHEPGKYPFAREHGLLMQHLRGLGIEVLDLAPAFSDAKDPHALWVSLDDAHPNALAHRRIAEASLAFLQRTDDEP
jgi:lysophospholipase L1-like esterase